MTAIIIRRLGVAAGAAVLGGALWWRKNPSACPYGQRFWVEPPHPLITRRRLRDVLARATLGVVARLLRAVHSPDYCAAFGETP